MVDSCCSEAFRSALTATFSTTPVWASNVGESQVTSIAVSLRQSQSDSERSLSSIALVPVRASSATKVVLMGPRSCKSEILCLMVGGPSASYSHLGCFTIKESTPHESNSENRRGFNVCYRSLLHASRNVDRPKVPVKNNRTWDPSACLRRHSCLSRRNWNFRFDC